ncbi:MAG TPA: alkaline phosphatase family protein [Tepidisphaeraceae bacterium]|nr:alkaline phosphatase family protein [Tepidisphaeraceae bacterium]
MLAKILPLLVVLWTFARPASGQPAASVSHDRHVVLIVCDGLRPDSVTPSDMPTLDRLAHDGTFFAHHHPVYLSSTEVNGTALATGAYPTHSGLMANNEYRRPLDPLKPFGTERIDMVREGDRLTGGLYLRMPAVAETVRAAGGRTVIAGTKGVALLLDRSERVAADPAQDSLTLFAGLAVPDELGHILQQPHVFPRLADPTREPNQRQDAWTTRTLIDRLWAGRIPAFTTLWFSEPDFAQHGTGPGSAVAKAALKSDDDDIAVVLKAIAAAGAADTTDVMVVSDHGFSTIEKTIDVVALLRNAGFDVATEFTAPPKPGQIMVVTNGGSFSLYVIGHDRDLVSKLVDFLQHADFAGVIFTRRGIEGTFTLDQAKVFTPDAPDILVAMRWDDQTSATGLPGMLYNTALKYGPGQGYHASLSRFDMHNTLIASGPDFRPGFVDEVPSGNVDVAPTILSILGIPQQKPMDGRVLSEALAGSSAPAPPQPETRTLHASRNTWRQYLKVSRVGSTLYFDEGNVEADAAPQARDWRVHPAIVQLSTSEDVYAMGDVHGDFQTMARLLAAGKLVDSAVPSPTTIHWAGGKSVLVCTGDVIDKYNHSLDVIAAIRSLQAQAQQAGGRVIVTMGNHEAEFLAGKFSKKRNRLVDGITLASELRSAGIDLTDTAAGRDSRGVGQFLRDLPIAAKVNDFFFCHAGNTRGLALNQLDSNLMQGIDRDGFGAPILSDPDSLLEARMHPTPWWEENGAAASAQTLQKNLQALGVRHLVFGHQPGKIDFADGAERARDELFQKFDGEVFLIDTGMSRGVDSTGGALLRIHADAEATALYADGHTRRLWPAP